MNIIGIIPSRYSSSRFPGKPLALVFGKPMIERVYYQASKSKALSYLAVATDDIRIFECVKNFGGNVILTSTDHSSGTERCFEAYNTIKETYNEEETVIINIQGDEPYIKPSLIDEIGDTFRRENIQILTLMKASKDLEEYNNPNVVKVVFNNKKQALYFSRHPIPYNYLNKGFTFHKHIGVYAYKAKVLKELVTLKSSYLETSESLEQLRWLEQSYQISLLQTNYETKAVDVPKDLENINLNLKNIWK